MSSFRKPDAYKSTHSSETMPVETSPLFSETAKPFVKEPVHKNEIEKNGKDE
jgi:hypothetical protein